MEKELPVIVQDSVQGLKYISRGKVELVKNDPGTVEHCLGQHSKLEDQLALGVRCVRAEVLLDVRVLVVVHPHTLVPGQLRQVGRLGSLAYTGIVPSASESERCSKTECKKPPIKAWGGRRETRFWKGRQDFAAPEKVNNQNRTKVRTRSAFPPGR